MWLLVYIPAVLGISAISAPELLALGGGRSLSGRPLGQGAFAVFGSLEEPERDGQVIRAVHRRPMTGRWSPSSGYFPGRVLGWDHLFLGASPRDRQSPALGIDDVRPATNLRKGLELAALTAAIGGRLLYSSIRAAWTRLSRLDLRLRGRCWR